MFDLTLNTMSVIHNIPRVTMTDTEVIPVGALCICFFTVTVEKYSQLLCYEKKSLIFKDADFSFHCVCFPAF